MGDLFRPATVGDAVAITPRLRQIDVEECDALIGEGFVLQAAIGTVAASPLALAWEHDGEVIALFGVAGSLLDTTGTPWMIGTDALDRQGRALIRSASPYIRQMQGLFSRLENVVLARNTRSIRWLKRLGFKFGPAVPMGVQGALFHSFSLGV